MDDSRSGAGGKIVAKRRKQRLAATPYDRPPPSPVQPTPAKSPNWFSGIIVPSARAIASGAGKIISSVMYTETESSSEDEDGDSAAEDNIGNEMDYEIPYDGVNAINKTETKQVIEQLIMQETFSREECDSLTKALKLRVVDRSMEAENRLASSPWRMINDEEGSILNKAVLEAKKWFQEKKMGSSSLEKRDKLVESAVGSPVDVARSYMRGRTPLASATKQIEFITPLTTTKELFKERTSYSVGHDSLSSLKKRSSLDSGSWSIQEELRRVRTRATEDMLRTPSSKVDPSLYTAATSNQESERTGGQMLDVTEPDSLRQTQLIALEPRQDGEAIEALSSKPDILTSVNKEDSEAVQINGELSEAEKCHSDPHPSMINGPPENEATDIGGRQIVNGIPSSQASFPTGVSSQQNDGQHNDGNKDPDKNKSAGIINLEGNCDLSTEACVEVPIVTEIDGITIGSPKSLGKQYEELSEEIIRPSTRGKTDKNHGEQTSEKPGGNSPRFRRSRRRGK